MGKLFWGSTGTKMEFWSVVPLRMSWLADAAMVSSLYVFKRAVVLRSLTLLLGQNKAGVLRVRSIPVESGILHATCPSPWT